MKKQRINLPLEYAVQPSFDEERFTKLRLKVMHNGLNRNNSNFDDDAIQDAAPSLANIPILAFVKKQDGEESTDFAGHEFEIKVVRDDLKIVYLGRPVGIIPESNNYEYTEDETGRKFVYVDAYVWNNYANEALDIIKRDEMKKISMEIDAHKLQYHEDYVDIKKYSYNGVALLGDDVQEGMLGAKAELVNYSQNKITEMLFELKEALKGGDEELDKEKVFSEETADATSHVEDNVDTIEETPVAEEAPVAEEETSVAEESSAAEEQPVEEAQVFTEEQYNALKSENEQLKTELARLQAFEAEIVAQAKQDAIKDVFSKFQEMESLEECQKLAEQAMDMNLTDLEDKLFALKGRHMELFTAKVETDIEEETEEKSDVDWDKLLFQHINTHNESGEPVWADIIKNKK